VPIQPWTSPRFEAKPCTDEALKAERGITSENVINTRFTSCRSVAWSGTPTATTERSVSVGPYVAGSTLLGVDTRHSKAVSTREPCSQPDTPGAKNKNSVTCSTDECSVVCDTNHRSDSRIT